eukprot:s2751_g2.t1
MRPCAVLAASKTKSLKNVTESESLLQIMQVVWKALEETKGEAIHKFNRDLNFATLGSMLSIAGDFIDGNAAPVFSDLGPRTCMVALEKHPGGCTDIVTHDDYSSL